MVGKTHGVYCEDPRRLGGGTLEKTNIGSLVLRNAGWRKMDALTPNTLCGMIDVTPSSLPRTNSLLPTMHEQHSHTRRYVFGAIPDTQHVPWKIALGCRQVITGGAIVASFFSRSDTRVLQNTAPEPPP